jgi:hypothetical protein
MRGMYLRCSPNIHNPVYRRTGWAADGLL